MRTPMKEFRDISDPTPAKTPQQPGVLHHLLFVLHHASPLTASLAF